MKRIALLVSALAGTWLVDASTLAQQDATPPADTIYLGGPIVTMVNEGDVAESMAVANGEIIAVGSIDNIMSTRGSATKVVNLQGRTLMPGFIDAHSHVVQQALKFSAVNLDPKPIGDVGTMADVQRKLSQRIKERKPEPAQWVIGWGYDDTGLTEMRHPTRDDLDAVSKEHPIVLMHISSHLMTANSKALEIAGINAATPDPDGGKIQRHPGSSEPTGVLEEKAMGLMLAALPSPTRERSIEMLRYGLNKYAEAGITTAQEGGALPGMLTLLESGAKAGMLPIDVVSYPVYATLDDASFARLAKNWNTPARYRVGGIKLVLDGSIQGYTAFLSKPYHVQPDTSAELASDSCASDTGLRMVLGDEATAANRDTLDEAATPALAAEHRGYANMTLEEVIKWVRAADEAGVPFLAHTNGDAATDIFIEAVKQVRKDQPRPELRSVIIHAQTIREDQLDFAATQGLVPSFFPIHVQFWGDRHRDIFLGPERAARIDPARSALRRGMKITLHHDAPVAGINILNVVSSAVNRRTTSGKVLGAEQAITPYQAFAAVTKDAAWQYFEEDRKGTLEVGKLADLVILSHNPLSIDPLKISSIQVIETIKEGATVFARQQ